MKVIEFVKKNEAKEMVLDDFITIYEYFTEEHSKDVSLVTADLHGPHINRMNKRSSKLYFITDGTLDLHVENKPYSLTSGDSLLIPPGAWHSMNGNNAKMLIICSPAFNGNDEIIKS